jgi:hypothetical protein
MQQVAELSAVIFGHGVVTRPEARESKAGSMRIDACDRSPTSPKMGKANGIAGNSSDSVLICAFPGGRPDANVRATSIAVWMCPRSPSPAPDTDSRPAPASR